METEQIERIQWMRVDQMSHPSESAGKMRPRVMMNSPMRLHETRTDGRCRARDQRIINGSQLTVRALKPATMAPRLLSGTAKQSLTKSLC